MEQINWEKYSKNTKRIDLQHDYDSIIEINWKGCPPRLTSINLNNNQISEINWEGCPQSLTHIYLSNNQISEINWKGCPQSLTHIGLSNNRISKMNWEGCPPPGLAEIYLGNKSITKMNWEGCPQGLTKIELFSNPITEINWKYVPWNLEFIFYCDLIIKYEEYKESRNNIPDLPYQCTTDEHKEFMNVLTHTFLLPPKENKVGFDSSYYKFKLYENGGISYRDAMKEMTS